jgi:spore coat protein U-like protein
MTARAWIGTLAVAAATAILLSSGTTPAAAATATANLAVTANVTNNCTITTAPVAFGAYDPVVANAATPLDSTGTVTVACTKGAGATVGLDLGTNASGAVRRLKDAGANYLTYELYQDAGRSAIWGNAGGSLYSAGAAPSKAPRSFTVYGRVAAGQDIPAAAYSDTIVATVNF